MAGDAARICPKPLTGGAPMKRCMILLLIPVFVAIALGSAEAMGGKLPKETSRSIQLCQSALQEKVFDESTVIRRETVFTSPAQIHAISSAQDGVRGKAVLRAGKISQNVEYNCVIDTRDWRIIEVTYRGE
jgi:hypothetical protein